MIAVENYVSNPLCEKDDDDKKRKKAVKKAKEELDESRRKSWLTSKMQLGSSGIGGYRRCSRCIEYYDIVVAER